MNEKTEHSVERLTKRNSDGTVSQTVKASAESVFYRLAAVEDILGDTYDLDRLRELVEADRDGRCVVFPCKPSGVTVYQLRGKKHARGRGVSPRHVGCATVWAGDHYQFEHQGEEPCRSRDFGKTWFLELEAAEAALKGEAYGG